MDEATFINFLRDLRDESGAMLHGSFACGKQDSKGTVSDIDLVVMYQDSRDPITNEVNNRPMDRAIAVFQRYGEVFHSCAIGHIGSARELGPAFLPRPVEVMDTAHTDPNPECPETVTIYGLEFKTYRIPDPAMAEDN